MSESVAKFTTQNNIKINLEALAKKLSEDFKGVSHMGPHSDEKKSLEIANTKANLGLAIAKVCEVLVSLDKK